MEWIGSKVLLSDPFYPSSKLCSGCGHKKDELNLSERVYICEACGLDIDRDYNASLNLRSVYSRSTTASSAGS